MSADLARLEALPVDEILRSLQKKGADGADIVVSQGASLSYSQRLGKIENLERAENFAIGIRALVGKRQAMVAINDTKTEAVDQAVERVLAMARLAPEDPFCGLAENALLATNFPDLDLADTHEPGVEELTALASEAEDCARAVQGVSNSEGAEASWSRSNLLLATSNGFSGGYTGSHISFSVAVLAKGDEGSQIDYDYAQAVFAEDLKAPGYIGKSAGERVVRRINPKSVKSGRFPVIFEARAASSMLSHLAGAINGESVARGMSFLKDSRGKKVFPETITIIDDPLRRRGLRSHPFDAEGLAVSRAKVVDQGVLQNWTLDLAAARQLGLSPTGQASRGVSSPPHPSVSNFYMEAGSLSPKELWADIKQGLYVTDLIGQGVNGVTGDYSRGASGFWIENGELAFPVSEITIAGNLKDIFAGLSAANDLEFRRGIDAPTLRIEAMTLAGQ